MMNCRYLRQLWTLQRSSLVRNSYQCDKTSRETRLCSNFASKLEEEQIEKQDLIRDVLHYGRQDISHQNVVVIMPRQRFGEKRKDRERAQCLLEETITLVKSVSTWNVISSEVIPTSYINSKVIFGKSNMEILENFVRYMKADAVVFALDMFNPIQHHFLRDYLGVEVYDRFYTVLKIFRDRASNKETKLQLALAELNYVKRNLHHLRDQDFVKFSFSKSFGGNFDTFYQVKKKILDDQESRIRKALAKVERNQEIQKRRRTNKEIPSVAVLGYTNSGKTSLIKSLTHDSRLVPEDRLFATLNVSSHQLHLSSADVLLIDTVGFISEIPTTFVHCFKSTLGEICSADLLVHVVDSSHPESEVQIETVSQTLAELNVPQKLISTMITVSNKIDKVGDISDCRGMPVSATDRIGLDQLKAEIERRIVENTERLHLKIRVPSGSEEFQWLFREASIVNYQPCDEDANYVLMRVVITKAKLGKFVKTFQ